MNKLECPICNETFNDSSRRARNMPCGHGFCSLCIDTNIKKGSRACPVCRREHYANSASDLPVSFLIEELLHNSAMSTSGGKSSDSENEEDEIEMCPKHKKSPLYFHCKSHGIKVCHSCAVLTHKPTSCDIISLEDQIEEKKEAQIANLQTQKEVLHNTEKDFKLVLIENAANLTDQQKKKQELNKEIEKLKQDIIKNESYQIKVKEVINGCQERQKSLDILTNKLKSATSNRKVEAQFKDSISTIFQCQRWEEAHRRDLNMSTNIKAVKDRYAKVDQNGITRSSKVLLEGRRTLVPTLSKCVITPRYASVLTEDELQLTSATATVFMDFSVRMQSIGRVFINIKGDTPHGQQFIMLALGSNGAMFKTSNLDHKGSAFVAMNEYVTEDGSRSTKSLLPIVKKSYTEKPKRGRIYPWNGREDQASFAINTKSNTCTSPDHFGTVIDGMDVIDLISSDEYAIKDVVISECGIILKY